MKDGKEMKDLFPCFGAERSAKCDLGIVLNKKRRTGAG